MTYIVSAVDRALHLLEIVAENQNIGLSELARLSGMNKTLTFRMATTLEARGFLMKDASEKTYSLGYKPLYLSEQVQHQSPLVRAANPVLDDLAARTRENVSMLVRDGLGTICVAIRQSPQPIRLYAELGRHGPLHVGGGPKLLLAFAPKDVQEAVLSSKLEAYTPSTLVDPKRLANKLALIREQGFNTSRGDLDLGAFSVAAPIRDHAGRVVASISVAGPQSRLTDDLENLYIRLLLDASTDISMKLGWRPQAAAE